MKTVKWYQFRSTFFLVGLIIALSLCNICFTYTTYDMPSYFVAEDPFIETMSIIPPTRWEESKSIPPIEKKKITITPQEIAKIIESDLIPEEVNTSEFIEHPSEPSDDYVEKTAPMLIPPAEPLAEEALFITERMPSFEGCDLLESESERRECTTQKLLTFIADNLKYPQAARTSGIEGTVFARFQVSKSGETTNVEIVRPLGGGFSSETIRVIKSFPKWSPGKQNGRPVNVVYTIPIRFKLQG